MSNLVPERRVDVNGRVVTRHVRTGKKTSQSVSSVAMPTFRSDTHRALAVAMRNQLGDYSMMRGSSPIRDAGVDLTNRSVQQYVNTLPDDVALTCLNRLFDNESDQGYPLLLISAAHSNESGNMLSDIDFLYDSDDEYHAEPTWNQNASMADNHVYLRAMVKGIRSHSKWGLILPERFTKAPVDEQQRVRAIYNFADHELTWEKEFSAIEVQWSKTVYMVQISVKDQELFKQIMKYPERTDELANFIHERGQDYSLLREYMDGDTPLRPGTL